MIIKFDSETDFAFFKDIAEWRHPNNLMTVRENQREIEFEGPIDRVMQAQGEQMNGVWRNG